MFIKSVNISGYKSLVNFKLDPLQSSLNIFIGENNVGKSNILKAIDVFFNKDVIEKSDLPIFLDSLSDRYIQRRSLFIEIKFQYDSSDLFPNGSVISASSNNTIEIRASFDDSRQKKFLCKNSAGGWYSIAAEKFNDVMPKFVYVGDASEKNLDIDTINTICPIYSIEEKENIETVTNQFLRNIWSKSNLLSINLSNDSSGKYDITIIDDYGNSNSFNKKSSGVQQLAFMGLFFAYNLTRKRSNIILAVEEPETNLHTKLQKKLFKYIKGFSEGKIQILLSTHSPIFIDKANHNSVFYVKRNNNNFTTASTSGFRDNWLSIRNDLGLGISDSLFLGSYNLIVEGPTEKILFPTVIDILNKKGIIGLKSDDVNILSAEGATNILYYAKLVSQMGQPTYIIVDNDREGKNAYDKINEDDDLVKNTRIFKINRNNFNECEIEDLLDDNIMIKCINKIYNSTVTFDSFNLARKNPHTENHIDKFSKMFERLHIGDDSKPNKLLLANTVKNELNGESDLSLLHGLFNDIDNFFSNN